ncbi:hypothetical protein HZS_8156 [Henneguya salminicola]|nr:hypothetical protein HZS_8156 [Henneguya salminicola]
MKNFNRISNLNIQIKNSWFGVFFNSMKIKKPLIRLLVFITVEIEIYTVLQQLYMYYPIADDLAWAYAFYSIIYKLLSSIILLLFGIC